MLLSPYLRGAGLDHLDSLQPPHGLNGIQFYFL